MKNNWLAVNALFFLLKIVRLTYRFNYIDEENLVLAKSKSKSGAYIFASWHQNILSLLLAHTKESFSMIVSSSKDGEIVSDICSKFGHTPVRGSSSKGGLKSLVKSISTLKSGLPLAITIDGPRGPLYDVKKGIFEISKKSQCPILAVTILPRSFWTIKGAWDNFRIPKPFTTITIKYSPAMVVAPESVKEVFDDNAKELKKTLLSNEEEISRLFT